MFLSGRGRLYAGAVGLAAIALFAYPDANNATAPLANRNNAALLRAVTRADLIDGDVVFRRGVGLLSNSVLALDGAALYSHVGIVRRVGDSVFVIHAEPKTATGLGYVVREPMAEFLSEGKASAFAVYRIEPRLSQSAVRASNTAMDYATRKVPFDDRFDASSSSAVYCTELVWRAYREAGLDLAPGYFHRATGPLGNAPIILISDIQNSHLLRMLVAWPSHTRGKS